MTGVRQSGIRAGSTKRRTFYVAAGTLMTLIAAVGFWPSYFGPLVHLTIERSAVIHVHAVVFVGWLVLFMAQEVN
jgi:hypothetical protein